MTTTQLLFRDDPYARDCEATVLAVTPARPGALVEIDAVAAIPAR